MTKARTFAGGIALLLTVGSAGCAEIPQPPMDAAQSAAYNNCMQNHWSSLADSAIFGVAGYEYHQNVVLGCQQYALTGASAKATDRPPQSPAPAAPAPSN